MSDQDAPRPRGGVYTTRQVAQALHVNPSTIVRWCQDGSLPSLQLPGGAYRISERDLEAWVEARRNVPRDRARLERLADAIDRHGPEYA